MPVTRINNNQISDASAGNAYVGINAAVKLQNYSVTATKIANNLTYGSDLTITGNLTIQGNTTTVDTTYTTIEDPVILLASNQTGTPAVDIGFIGERGSSQNIAFIWDESASEFVTVYTNDAETNTTVSIASYASFHTKDANIGGNIVVNGTTSLIGNVLGNINGTGNINYANGYFSGNVTVIGTFQSTSNIVANASGIFYGNSITGNGAIYGGVPGYTSLGSNVVIQFAGNANSYSQVNFQNISNGTLASTDYIATADNGDDNNYYIDVGINSSTFNDPVDYPGFFPNDSYVHNHGGNLLINPESAGKVIKLMVGGTANSDVIGTVSSTGLYIVGTTQSTGNITGGNLITAGQVTATGNITGGNVSTAGQVTATGNVTGGNLVTGGRVVATGNIVSSANISGGNLAVTGTITSATLETTGNVLVGGNLTVQGNIQYINVDDLRVEDPIIIMGTGPNGAPLTTDDGMDRGIYMEWYKTGLGNSWIGWDNSSGNLVAAADVVFASNNVVNVNAYGTFQAGNIYSQSAVATGNITGGNLLTAGLISATGNIVSAANVNGANLNASANVVSVGVVATGNITGGNILTAGIVSATGNIVSAANVNGANLNASANVVSVGVVASGNITGGNLLTAGVVTATGNITGGNLITPNLVSAATVTATGNITGANVNTSSLTLNGSNLNSNAARITINSADADVDFAVDGSGAGNVFYVDAGTRTASFGSSTQTTNALVSFNAPTSVLMPVGNTAQRPGTGVTGMLRFNSTLNGLEVYDNSQWNTVGTPIFTVISDQQFTGNGVQTVFTLSSDTQTTNSVIVSINGVIQIPTTAYSVSGTSLTFTEAPQTGDLIDVRGITTTTTITSIANAPGNAVIATNPTTNQVTVTGNLVPVANATQSLGNASLQWKDIYVAGNTIYLGGLQLQATGNTFVVYTADGVTQANIDVGNVDVSAINSGTSIIGLSQPNGNAYITVGGTANVLVVGSTGANITGTFGVSGNVTGGNLTTAGQVSATGNITGGNLSVGTGTITVNNIVNGGSNGVGNIGSASTYFNTVFAKATSAQYADLAENYAADAAYEPGTVLSFGGANEVTVSSVENDRRIAGVVSTNPSYIMNAVLDAEHVATIALTGRVPTFVSGSVEKGDMMVSAGNGRAVACATPVIGTVIGKALENHAGGDGIIEVVVGRL